MSGAELPGIGEKMQIHPTAVVAPGAELASDVVIEAYSIIGPNVTIGAGSVVGPHAVIDGITELGSNNRVFPFTSLGLPPQDITYRDEKTRLVIGNDNIIRESVTISRGTERGKGITRIGNGNFLMAYTHVAHDCVLGDRVVMANSATLGGHVEVGDGAVIGGIVAIHQFVRIGEYSCVGGFSGMRMDVPPYMLVVGGDEVKVYGPNLIGLKRNNFSDATIQAIKKCYRIFSRSGLTVKEAVERARKEVEPFPEVGKFIEFAVSSSKRGVYR
ncbi:MAG: acyl-ACP--UDP-N-acetylglucosamine O-acyltransferase [Desulfobacteraceae bacterium]|nr:acyl-ACP--UDP-N-acetylglucosamine O-acyltransferase [Desulfobacteraceae bacterium]